MIRLPEAWLTRHALDRARQMGVTTDRAVRIAHDPHTVLPDPQGNPARRFLWSRAEPDLALIADITSAAIVTVLWWSPDRPFTREEGEATTA